MTVVHPNAVSGINSITVQSGNSLQIHKADGSLIRTITGVTGVTTFATVSVGSATTDFAQCGGIKIGLGASISNGSGNALTFGTGGDDRVNIDSSGKVLIGNPATYSANGLLHIVGDDNSNGPELYLQVNNNNTTDNIGAIWFGNNVDKSLVKLAGHTHTANNTADFTVSTSSAGTSAERLRITSDGKLGLGVASPASESGWGNILHINSASAGAHIRFTDNTSGSGAGDGSFIGHYGNDTYLVNKESSGVIIFLSLIHI